jgi:hypothetical protein
MVRPAENGMPTLPCLTANAPLAIARSIRFDVVHCCRDGQCSELRISDANLGCPLGPETA